LLFGQLAEHLEQRRIDVAVYEGTTAAELIERFGLTDWLARGVSVAIDGEIGDTDRILHDGAEIALLPPVSGG
jgi:molybdopterin converting factor small subunit